MDMGSMGELLQELRDVLSRLSEEAASGKPLLVEGKSDVRALRSLGVEGRFITTKSGGRSIPDLALELASSWDEVIILTDFDEAGRELARRWAVELEGLGLKANMTYWRWLRGLVGSFAKDVEGLPSLIETLMRKTGIRLGKGRW